jgi:hypothetical protein
LAWQRNHATHQIGLDDGLANLIPVELIARHRSVRQHEAHHTIRRQVTNDVLHPRIIRVARRWCATLPKHILAHTLAAPIAGIERRICQNKIGAQILVQIMVERIGVCATNASSMLRIANVATVRQHELFAMHEHPV